MSDQPPPQETPPEYFTDMPVGEILRRGREHYGQTLEEVEKNLRIRAIQLHALETNNLEALPGKAYALGFVRSYSEYLGLDGDKMVQLFKRQSVGNKIEPHLNFPIPASDSKIPAISFAVICAVLGIVFIGMWMSDRDKESLSGDINDVPPIEAPVDTTATTKDIYGPSLPDNYAAPAAPTVTEPAAQQEAAVNTASSPTEAVAAETPAPVPQEDGIILNVVENSWVEIRDAGGRAIVSRVLKAGDQYFVPDRPDLRMSLGNASGVQIVVDGKALPFLGARGEVKRNISLETKSLKSLAGLQE